MSSQQTQPVESDGNGPVSSTAAAAHPIMFWVLTGLALLIFAPCVLVPLWFEKEQLRAYEQSLTVYCLPTWKPRLLEAEHAPRPSSTIPRSTSVSYVAS